MLNEAKERRLNYLVLQLNDLEEIKYLCKTEEQKAKLDKLMNNIRQELMKALWE